MKIFSCSQCNQVVFFENVRCTRCGTSLAYLPDRGIVVDSQREKKGGLVFSFMENEATSPVLTGHGDGHITLNIAERPGPREAARAARRDVSHARRALPARDWPSLLGRPPRLGGDLCPLSAHRRYARHGAELRDGTPSRRDRPGPAPARDAGHARALDLDDFDDLLGAWFPLTFALSSLNRGMGLADLYPFVLSERAIEKLRFVHEVVDGVRAPHAIAER